MSNKKQQIPAIRFNGFTDAWEQRKLDDISEKVTEKNKNRKVTETLTNSAEYGIISQSDFFDKDISNINNIDGYYVVRPDDFVYNPRISNYAPVGPIKRNNLNKIGVMSPLYYVFRIKDIDPSFLEKYFDTAYWHMFMKLNGDSGARADRFAIKDSVFKQMPIPYPSIEEQVKLGNFFKQLDDTIALHQRQLDNYKALKKVMLQKIFNQELRFKDQEGNNYPDWEKIALNELGETYTGLSGKTKENFGKGKGRFVTYMNVYSNPIADLAMTENVEIKDGENQNEVCYGDIFFTTSSETPEEVGMSSVWLSHESKVYLNSFCFGYRLSSRSEGVISPDFLGFQLRAPHIRKKIIFLAQGSTRFNISKSKLMDIVVYMPTIEEQNKITAFLLNVDSRIKHTIQSIERLNMLKKALLQQMFI